MRGWIHTWAQHMDAEGPLPRGKVTALTALHHPAYTQLLLISASSDDSTVRIGSTPRRRNSAARHRGTRSSLLALSSEAAPQDGPPTIVFGSPRGARDRSRSPLSPQADTPQACRADKPSDVTPRSIHPPGDSTAAMISCHKPHQRLPTSWLPADVRSSSVRRTTARQQVPAGPRRATLATVCGGRTTDRGQGDMGRGTAPLAALFPLDPGRSQPGGHKPLGAPPAGSPPPRTRGRGAAPQT